VALDLSCDQSC
jgi:hypothetical protein